MADRIKGITIEIDGNTSNLQKSLKSLDGSLRQTQNKLKDINKLLKLNPSNTELLSQKQKALAKEIKGTKERLNELKAAQEGVAKGTEEWDALQREIIATQQELKELKSEYRDFGSVASQQLKVAGEKLKDVGSKMTEIGSNLTKKVTVPIVAGFTAAVKTTADFDSAMSQVAATMGKTTAEISELRDFAREMGATTAFSASEAAEAMNYMALAGYKTNEIMKMLPTVLNLAAAGNIDLASASDMVTDAQSALGLSMEDTTKMVDQMAAASSNSNTSVAQLGEAILKIGATARNVKGGTAELATILGVLADNGIKGSEGGTHLRNIMLSLQESAENGAVKFGDLAVSIYDSEGNMRSMIDIIGDIQGGLGNMTQEAKDTLISGVFNKTDLAAVNALLGTSAQRFDELGAAISGSKDAAKTMAETQLDNLNGQLTLLKSAIQELAISLGDTLMPTIRQAVTWLQQMVDKFNALDPKTKETIVKIGLIVAAVGPLLMILGSVVSGFGALISVLSFLVSPVGLVVAAIAALVAIGIALYKNWDEIKAKAVAFWEGIKQGFELTRQDVTNSIERLKTSVSNTWQKIRDAIEKPIQQAWDTVSGIVDKIRGMFNFQLSFPHIALPHFSWTWSDLGLIKIPHVSVEWYKKAYDQPYMFTSPTVVGNKGFGDGNGAEMVYGKDNLMRDIRDAMASNDQPIVITVQSILDGRIVGQSVTRYQRSMARAMGA